MVGPLTLNEVNDVLLITVSIIVVVPATFKLPFTVKLFKLVGPDTLKDDNNVDAPETNKLVKLVLLFKFDIDVLLLFIYNCVDVEKFENVVVST